MRVIPCLSCFLRSNERPVIRRIASLLFFGWKGTYDETIFSDFNSNFNVCFGGNLSANALIQR
jgi:hypothetical protein